MPELNKRYVRKGPDGSQSIIFIKTEEEEVYHQDLAKNGYIYTEVVTSVAPESTCIACEG